MDWQVLFMGWSLTVLFWFTIIIFLLWSICKFVLIFYIKSISHNAFLKQYWRDLFQLQVKQFLWFFIIRFNETAKLELSNCLANTTSKVCNFWGSCYYMFLRNLQKLVHIWLYYIQPYFWIRAVMKIKVFHNTFYF